MKIEKEHILGVVLGLIPVVILYFVLEYRPFAKANQTAKQKNSMHLTIDMYRYLGWFPEEKKMLKKAPIKAIDNLEVIRDYLQQLDFTGQLIELKKSNLAIADRLIRIYDGIDSKEQEGIKKSFAEFNSLYSQYSEKLEEVIKKDEPVAKLPEGFDPKKEEIKFAQNQRDRQVYLNAVELIKERRFGQAYKDLASLKDKYKDTVFENCIKLKMSDCLLMSEPNNHGGSVFNPEEGMAFLSGILESREYSPVLFDAFSQLAIQFEKVAGNTDNTTIP